MPDNMDRNSVESVHRLEDEVEFECTHKYSDGSPAGRVLLGQCVLACGICGDQLMDLNPLCTPPLRVQREEVSTFEEIAQALMIEAVIAQERKERREQRKFVDGCDL